MQAGDSSLPASGSGIKVLHFTLPNMQLFVRLDQVLRVLPIMSLAPVPQAPAYLKGLMNLAGRSLPVIDLAQRIELAESIDYNINTPILMCTDGERTAGLLVEEVLGIEEMVQEDMQMRPLFNPSDTPVLGVIDTRKGLSMCLDLSRVLAIDLKEPELERRAVERSDAVLKGTPAND